jgi:hypothetical protein
MPDNTPASPAPERTVVVSAPRSRLFTILTIVNSVLLALIIIGAVIHHHRMKREQEHGWGGGGHDGGCERGFHGGFEKFRHFHRFGYDGGPGMGGPGGPGMDGPGMGRHGGFGGGGFGGPGGEPRHGMGMGGMGMRQGGMGMAGNPDQMTDAVLQHLSQQLSLTDDEKAKIKPLVQADVAEMQKNAQAFRESMQKEFENAKAQIKPLLNADQQKQLDAMPTPGPKPPGEDGDSNGPAAK